MSGDHDCFQTTPTRSDTALLSQVVSVLLTSPILSPFAESERHWMVSATTCLSMRAQPPSRIVSLTESSHIIDVFAAQPSVAGGSEIDQQHTPEMHWSTNGHLSADEMAMRTIKKGRAGPIFSIIQNRPEAWKAVQDAIG